MINIFFKSYFYYFHIHRILVALNCIYFLFYNFTFIQLKHFSTIFENQSFVSFYKNIVGFFHFPNKHTIKICKKIIYRCVCVYMCKSMCVWGFQTYIVVGVIDVCSSILCVQSFSKRLLLFFFLYKSIKQSIGWRSRREVNMDQHIGSYKCVLF